MEHWTGSTWQLVRVPSPPLTGVGASLLGVAATSPRNIWAVGDYADGKRFQPLIEHFNGTRWALIPAPAAGTAELNRISFMAPSNGWAVGSSGGGSHTQALIEHWNGHHWTIARTPAIPGSTNLADVLALTPHLAGPSAATPHPTAVAAPSSNDGTAGPGPSPPAPNAHPPANCWASPAPHSTSGRSAPPSPTP